MTKPPIESLRVAVEELHGGEATFERFERVTERHGGDVVWEGDIAVFAIASHTSAKRAYAWSEPVAGSDLRRFFAVLHEGPVTSATLAFRASVVKDGSDRLPTNPDPTAA